MNKKQNNQIKTILKAGIVMFFGLVLFKYIPMLIWGNDILFDASAHITVTCFILYIIWFFIDQNKKWRIPFFIFCFLVLAVISFQRIYTNHHNDVGLLGGILISLCAIIYSQNPRHPNKIDF